MSANLMLSGGPGHDFEATTSVLEALSAEAGLAVTVATEPSELFVALRRAERGETRPWDLVTFNALRWRMEAGRYAHLRESLGFDLDGADALALARHVHGGGGLVVLHAGVICFDAEPTWRRLVGASWRWGVSSHPPVGEADVTVTEAGRDHPLTVGIESFCVVDEIYEDLDPVGDLVPLLSATRCGREHPLLWARTIGEGRVVTDVLGHGIESMTHPAHRTVLGRALSWSRRAVPHDA